MVIYPQRLTIYLGLYSAHRAVIFAIAHLSCFRSWYWYARALHLSYCACELKDLTRDVATRGTHDNRKTLVCRTQTRQIESPSQLGGGQKYRPCRLCNVGETADPCGPSRLPENIFLTAGVSGVYGYLHCLRNLPATSFGSGQYFLLVYDILILYALTASCNCIIRQKIDWVK